MEVVKGRGKGVEAGGRGGEGKGERLTRAGEGCPSLVWDGMERVGKGDG